MANEITTFKKFLPLVDEVYSKASQTSVLDGDSEYVKAGANANELVIQKMDMDGLGDYDKDTNSYSEGSTKLTNETIKCDYDRSKMFTVDAVDDIETAGIAFGKLAGEFERTKVAPEIDAYRLSAYASTTGIGSATGTLTTGDAVIKAIRKATNAMDEAEVSTEDRILYITPTLKGYIDDLDTSKSKAVLNRFSEIVEVPQTRFYSKIDLGDNGYSKAEDAKDINFMVVQKHAVVQFIKHNVPKVITPEANQTGDAWKFGLRIVAVAQVLENKLSGVYVNTVA